MLSLPRARVQSLVGETKIPQAIWRGQKNPNPPSPEVWRSVQACVLGRGKLELGAP